MGKKDRTSDGFLTVAALRRGAVEQQAWKDDGVTHVTIISLIDRGKDQPPMYRVNHRAYAVVVEQNILMAQEDVIFDDIRKARNHFKRLRKHPPDKTIDPMNERIGPW